MKIQIWNKLFGTQYHYSKALCLSCTGPHTITIWAELPCGFNSTTLYSMLPLPLNLTKLHLAAGPLSSYLLYISQERWGCWILGKYFERSCNGKVSINGPLTVRRNNCVTTIFHEKSLQPMISSENFSFSEKLLQKKILFVDGRAGGLTCVKYVELLSLLNSGRDRQKRAELKFNSCCSIHRWGKSFSKNSWVF